VIPYVAGSKHQRTSRGRQHVVAQGVASPDTPTQVAEKTYKLGGKYELKVRTVCPIHHMIVLADAQTCEWVSAPSGILRRDTALGDMPSTNATFILLVHQVVVDASGEEQRVKLTTQYPGKLLLHWGVTGGQDYQGGWRLPGDAALPQGTVAYKNRALQTPFRWTMIRTVHPSDALSQCCNVRHWMAANGHASSSTRASTGLPGQHSRLVSAASKQTAACGACDADLALECVTQGTSIEAVVIEIYRDAGGEARELELVLSGPEASDSLVFVFKDGSTWYDNRGDNFEVCSFSHMHPLVASP